MKKNLLLSAMAVSAVMASAQVSTNAEPAKIDKNFSLKDLSEKAELYVPGSSVAAPNNAFSNNKLSYQRPRGQFYLSPYPVNVDGYWLPGGGMVVTPFTELEFKNLSTMPNENGYTWKYFEFDSEAGWGEKEDKSFDHKQSFINNYLPGAVTLAYSSFTFGDVCYRYSSNEYTEYDQNVFPVANTGNMIEDFGDDLFSGVFEGGFFPVSPKYFGAGCRARNSDSTSGFVYYTGAGESGEDCWFGQGSPYSAMGVRFEKPDQPYVIKGVYLYGFWQLTGPVTFPVKIYKVVQDAYYGPGEDGEDTNFPAQLGELICEGSVEVKSGESDDDPFEGYLECKFFESDGVVTLEVTPEITDEIMVVVENINDPKISRGSFLISRDSFDEGYGNLGLIGYASAENPTEDVPRMWGLTHFFLNNVLQTAPTIFLDVERGWIVNYENDGDTFVAPAAGCSGDDAKELILRSFMASGDGMDWEPTLEDGEELPDWLTINLQDYYQDGDYAGIVFAEISVDPLPEGTEYREVNVLFEYPGAKYVYTVKQGDAASVEVVGSDVEVVATKYYDLQGREMKNVPENGIYIQKSILKDGSAKSVKVIR